MTSKLITAIIIFVAKGGYFGVFAMMALGCACIPLPSEIVMLAAGWKSSEGLFNYWWVIFWGVVGCVVGSIFAYWVGYYGGRPLVHRYRRYFLISAHDLQRADAWFERYGDATVFFSRLLPIIRAFISLPAGVARMPFWRFCFYTFLGSIPWCWGLTYLGFHTGRNWGVIEAWLHRFDLIILALLVLGVVWWVHRHLKHLRVEHVPSAEELSVPKSEEP